MRYRKLDQNGDMVFGHGGADYHHNSPAGVVQAVKTRLNLWRGEWFLDSDEGTAYVPSILGMHTQDSRDLAISERVLGTPGVKEILEYESDFNPNSRALAVYLKISTVYGPAEIQEVL